ncbi:HipA domain-containing protein [Achromobacter seleniivolatilans]|uniref:HipA domain-containing protein n=1 Tax=Achromobacter seleniivolatilans TaxID=3047478 RepID=A0ABY9M0U3_9BURK|nr:HipA domain-containing protein [Achromobacter sp. R39]WMD19813.1 HipA domain-containing protein [Achromobacter sp. R39]
MVAFASAPAQNTKTELDVCLGKVGMPVGKLVFVRNGPRMFSQFAYFQSWLEDKETFSVSPDLVSTPVYQTRKPPAREDSRFFLAMGDTEPDAWGRRVISRAHAKRRQDDRSLGALTELDYLCAVDDFSRIGALRLRDSRGTFLQSVQAGKRATPPMLELEKMLVSSQAVERGTETAEDLRYLQGKGTSLGGMRPKCSILDEHGFLALGKFPSIQDERNVTRAEVLALKLATLAGINAADAHISVVQNIPVAVIRRFDRAAQDSRIPYMSGASLIQASRMNEHAYTEVLDQMKGACANYVDDARQLWRRLVFNHLITNVDDHLQNIGFLYMGNKQWQLSPAFDINPMPEKDRESKTWLSEDTGPITSMAQLMSQSSRFSLNNDQALAIVQQVVAAVLQWRKVGQSADVGMTSQELSEFDLAFEHSDLDDAKKLAAR